MVKFAAGIVSAILVLGGAPSASAGARAPTADGLATSLRVGAVATGVTLAQDRALTALAAAGSFQVAQLGGLGAIEQLTRGALSEHGEAGDMLSDALGIARSLPSREPRRAQEGRTPYADGAYRGRTTGTGIPQRETATETVTAADAAATATEAAADASRAGGYAPAADTAAPAFGAAQPARK
jgi:hypothetical protein